jgi:hypothetical protein
MITKLQHPALNDDAQLLSRVLQKYRITRNVEEGKQN